MDLQNDKLIISCGARSGSTLLLSQLRSNPDICMHGEIFGKDKIGHLWGPLAKKRQENPEYEKELNELLDQNPAKFLYEIAFSSQGHKIAGFKFKNDEAFLPQFQPILESISKDKDIKIIYLVRDRLFDQYVSHQVVLNQSGPMRITSDDERNTIVPFEVDIDHCLHYFHHVIDDQAKAKRAYEGHPNFTISFDDLLDKEQVKLAELQRFLQVSVCHLTSPTKKIINKKVKKLVKNFRKVRKALISNGFEALV